MNSHELQEKVTLLLPYYLDDTFLRIFEAEGLRVVWAPTAKELEVLVAPLQIDLAIEWQHSEKDFTVRDMLRRLGKETPVFLALNWNCQVPRNFETLGYAGFFPIPFDLREMQQKFFSVLPEAKKMVFKETSFPGQPL